MNCGEARERILEAELAELRETGDSTLSKHIRLCRPCRGMAEHVLRSELALGRALDAVAPHVDLERVTPPTVASLHRRRRFWTRAVSALAAAGLAALALSQAPLIRQGPRPVPQIAGAAFPQAPSVEPPPGRGVVVFETDNPDIVVIWFY